MQRVALRLLLWSCLSSLSHGVFAIALGNMEVQSNDPLVSEIAIIYRSSELHNAKSFQVHVGNVELYQKLGLTLPEKNTVPELSIVKNSNGLPANIKVAFPKDAFVNQTTFSDLVLELSWSTGKLIRVYTVLHPKRENISVKDGDRLGQLANELATTVPQADLDQVLVALYRLNPKAFISGNIHRLKSGEKLEVPSSQMVESIPKSEAKSFVASAGRDYNEKRFNRSSESSFKASYQAKPLLVSPSSAEKNPKLSQDESKDRLQVGSSVSESESNLAQVQLNEQLVAQKKLLDDANARIETLEKNIAELKAIAEKKEQAQRSFSFSDFWNSYQIPLALSGLIGVFLFGITRRANLPEGSVKWTGETLRATSHEAMTYENSMSQSELLTPTIAEQYLSNSEELPVYAKELLAKIDLSLPSDALGGVEDAKLSLNLDVEPSNATPSVSPTFANEPIKLDLATSSSNYVKSPVADEALSPSDQRLRLNLAKSYIRIQDIATAKILLQDLIQINQNVEPDVLEEARQLLLDIA